MVPYTYQGTHDTYLKQRCQHLELDPAVKVLTVFGTSHRAPWHCERSRCQNIHPTYWRVWSTHSTMSPKAERWLGIAAPAATMAPLVTMAETVITSMMNDTTGAMSSISRGNIGMGAQMPLFLIAMRQCLPTEPMHFHQEGPTGTSDAGAQALRRAHDTRTRTYLSGCGRATR